MLVFGTNSGVFVEFWSRLTETEFAVHLFLGSHLRERFISISLMYDCTDCSLLTFIRCLLLHPSRGIPQASGGN